MANTLRLRLRALCAMAILTVEPLAALSRSAWSLCGLGHMKARHCLSLPVRGTSVCLHSDTRVPPGRSSQVRERFLFVACRIVANRRVFSDRSRSGLRVIGIVWVLVVLWELVRIRNALWR